MLLEWVLPGRYPILPLFSLGDMRHSAQSYRSFFKILELLCAELPLTQALSALRAQEPVTARCTTDCCDEVASSAVW